MWIIVSVFEWWTGSCRGYSEAKEWVMAVRATPDVSGKVGGFEIVESTDMSHAVIDSSEPECGPLTSADLVLLLKRLPVLDREISDRARVEQLSLLESIKNAAAAAQAQVALDLDVSQREAQALAGVPAARRGLGIAGQVGAARRESPVRGSQHLGLAKILHELPHTRAAFVAGEVSEWRVMLVARATATLELADRVEVDARLAGQLAGMSDRRAEAAAKAIAYELDPMSPFKRARAAVSDRRVSVRPAPDVMALVTGFVPCAQGVAVKKALRQGAEAIYHAQTADDPRNRTLTQIEADLFVQRLTGQARAEDVDIEVGLVITDTALIAGGATPARLEGYGPIPAALARELLRPDGGGVDQTDGQGVAKDTRAATTDPSATAVDGSCGDIGRLNWAASQRPESGETACTTSGGQGGQNVPAEGDSGLRLVGAAKGGGAAEAKTAARIWLRRLFADPVDGSLVGRDAKRRLFRGSLRAFIVARDQTCRTPYCDAPIRDIDHIVAWAAGGTTTPEQGQGLCRRCNLDKQAPGWSAQVVDDEDHSHTVTTITPTATRPDAHAPSVLPTYRPPPGRAGPGLAVSNLENTG